MKVLLILLCLIIVCLFGCSSNTGDEPCEPIVRYGSTPTINGVFEDGEWDDATVVQVCKEHHIMVKHDVSHLYFGFVQDGGNLWLYKDKGLHVLHASAQLGDAKYDKSKSMTVSLNKSFEWQLYGLQNESMTNINEILAEYLAKNGWVSSTGPLGNLAQSEWAVSFDFLGISNTTQRYAETPGLYIFSARMRLSPEEKNVLAALPPDDRKNQFTILSWPISSPPNDSLNNGQCPETISIDQTAWGKICIDLGKEAGVN